MDGQKQKEKPHRAKISASREIAHLALMVALIAVCTYISIPFGQVPFTLQTFAVCLAGGLLGAKRGAAAVLVYLLAGLCGVPVFAGFQAGAAALAGPTGGYLWGFLGTALLSGAFAALPAKGRGYAALLGIGMALGVCACYACGTLWFCLIYRCSVWYALGVCVLPYLLADAAKVSLAAAVCLRLRRLPRGG